jgi:hypothetical protein
MSKPDFVNEKGVRWWKETILSRHATETLGDNHIVWRLETPDGEKFYLLLKGEEPIAEALNYESMAYKIDGLGVLDKEQS